MSERAEQGTGRAFLVAERIARMDGPVLKALNATGSGREYRPENAVRDTLQTLDDTLAAVRQLRTELTEARRALAQRDAALAKAEQRWRDSEALRVATAEMHERLAEALAEERNAAALNERRLLAKVAALESVLAGINRPSEVRMHETDSSTAHVGSSLIGSSRNAWGCARNTWGAAVALPGGNSRPASLAPPPSIWIS